MLHQLLRKAYYLKEGKPWENGRIDLPSNYEILIASANQSVFDNDIYISLN